ncbi:MAG: carbohydrate ABC transporter permease [Verrucomicrobia bacterium]|nr:carbohydrate ABC transporter permease [Verrucomicrobiota bacterium]
MTASRLARLIVPAALLGFTVLTLLPFAWMLCAAFKQPGDIAAAQFLPTGPGFLGVAWHRLTTENFFRLFSRFPMGAALLHSLFLASVTSVLATFCCAAGGYALAKFRFRGREFVTTAILGTVVLPGALLLGPGFETTFHLGLLDTYAAIILPGVAPAFGLYLFRQAMLNSVPTELIESARLDGCGEIRIFTTVVLPLVRPMVGTFLALAFIGTWNNFIGPQIMLQTPDRYPLSVAIYNLRGLYGGEYGLIMAGTLVAIAPVMSLFLFLQRDFISGLTSGAVKG